MSRLPLSSRQESETTPPPPIPIRGRYQSGALNEPDVNPSQTPAHAADRVPVPARHRFLSPGEWAILAHGVGGLADAERHTATRPTSWWWPPRGMPRGLFKDAVTQRAKFFYLFHGTSMLRWLLMIMQLLIGAGLTAIGSLAFRDGTPITVLGAGNTVIAGLLALLHNSGLPDRYRHDMAEFEAVEDHIQELLDSGIAPADLAVDQILAGCFDLFQNAKATVAVNMPVNYNSGQAVWTGRQSAMAVPPRPASRAPGAPAQVAREKASSAAATDAGAGK